MKYIDASMKSFTFPWQFQFTYHKVNILRKSLNYKVPVWATISKNVSEYFSAFSRNLSIIRMKPVTACADLVCIFVRQAAG